MKVDWAEMLLPCMRAIRDRFHETVGLAVVHEGAAVGVIVEAVQETGRFGFTLCAGHRFPLHTGAPAKAVLAFLPKERQERLVDKMAFTRFTAATITSRAAFRKELSAIRACGYALDRAEEVEGCHCLAVPVFDSSGLPIAGVWFTGPSKRLPLDKLKSAYPELRALVDQAQRSLQTRLKELTGASCAAKKIEQACGELASEPFAETFDLERLSRSLGMSYSAFRHAFKAQVGVSPAQYRLARRVAAAREKLETTALSLAEIADRTGFPSPAHFSTVFKKKTGLSPRDCRAAHRSGAKPANGGVACG